MRIDHAVTSGTFSLDGGTWDVENNVWVLGDRAEGLAIDAPYKSGPILDVIGGRRVIAILLTHSHDDHVTAVGDLVAATGAAAYLHPDHRVVWDLSQQGAPGGELADGDEVTVGDVEVTVLHTPGHSPGACCFEVPTLGVVFIGDTLFQGGPGATGRFTATTRPSWRPLATHCSPSRQGHSSSPGTATRRRSAPSAPTCGIGSTAAPDWWGLLSLQSC